jgi:spermidine synthase
LPAATNVAVTGLGAGGLLAYAEAGQHWTMYEIDPVVERIAQNTNYFTYLSDCPAAVRIVMGDARLSLAGADEQYDVMILDAYNSDALPVHLITREALAVYLARLAPRGVLAFHISNRYLDLTSVVSRLAADAKLFCLVQDEQRLNIAWLGGYRHLSNWAVMTRQPEVLQGLERDSRWSRPSPRTDTRIWTDDYSSVFSVFKWRFTTSP